MGGFCEDKVSDLEVLSRGGQAARDEGPQILNPSPAPFLEELLKPEKLKIFLILMWSLLK